MPSATVSHQYDGYSDDQDEETPSFFVRALYDFESDDASSLSFRKGALIEVLTQLESGWWDGLLDNQVRGWFPSNYVEPIPDREAEIELLARAQMQFHQSLDVHASPEHDSYSRLGFGAGFDGLQALIKSDDIGNSDAFSQLAEAAMLDPRRHVFDNVSSSTAYQQLSTEPSRRPSATGQAQSNFESQNRTAYSAQASATERSRAASSPNTLADSYAAFSSIRPRAATASANRTELGYLNSDNSIAENLHDLSLADIQEQHDEGLRPQIMARTTSSGQASSSDSRGNDSEALSPPSASNRRPTASRLSPANSSNTAVVRANSSFPRAPSTNSVDRMPNINTIPSPWTLRLTDDEKSFFFVHRYNSEIRWDYTDARTNVALLPNMSRQNSVETPSSSSATSVSEGIDSKRASRQGQALLGPSSNLNFDSDDSELDGELHTRLPGKSPILRNNAHSNKGRSGISDLTALSHHHILSPPDEGPPDLAQEEQIAYEIQKALVPAQVKPISLLVRRANEAIRQLAAIATEQIGTDGLSDAERATWNNLGNPYMPRLTNATSTVVTAIRELLYASGSLSISASDLVSASKLVTSSSSEPTDQFTHFSELLQNLSGSLSLKPSILQYSGVNPKEALAATPSSLYPIGRKLNAVISKLVLSSRQVIDHTVTLSSSPTSGLESTMTDLDADVFSKLYQCRQRLREDALELMRTLQTFSAEAERARSTALGTHHTRGWLRRSEASMESDVGLNGVGPTSYGSGIAGSWLGNGFSLPSKYEVASLKSEISGARTLLPFEHKSDADAAVVRGAAILRRLPTQQLRQPMVASLCATLEAMSAALSKSDSDTQYDFHFAVREMLQKFSNLSDLVESIDLASSLDVDGPGSQKTAETSPINDRNMVNAANARDLSRRFVVLKQASFDAASLAVLRFQESLSETSVSNKAVLHQACKNLLSICTAVVATLDKLSKVADEQFKSDSPFLGARAYVYGSDDPASTPTSAMFSRRSGTISSGLHEEVEELNRYGRGDDAADDFMYLGPGIVVPNGPHSRAGSTAVSKSGSTISSPTASFGPSGRGGSGIAPSLHRRGSTSGTTGGGSVRSMQSYADSAGRHGGSRRGPLAEGLFEEGPDEDGDSRKVGQKARRILGDDAPLSSSLTHDSEASGASTSTRRKEPEIPWFLEPDYMGDDIVIAQDGSVKGATLEALMARLTMHNSFDASFNNTFLMTYRSFTTTRTLLDLLAQRFRILPPRDLTKEELAMWTEKKQIPIRLRVFNVLKSWLESHFYEGEDDEYLDQVRKFAIEEMGEAASMKAPSQHLLRLVERRQGEGEQMIRKMVLPHSAPAPILPKNLKKIKLLEIDPLELARQLTLMESRLYNKVRPVECLGLKWAKANNDIYAAGIMHSITTHNHISAWVAEAILQQEDLKRRAAIIKQFINVADRCRSLNNFSGMWAIVSALSTAPIHRLRRTWDAVNQKNVVIFESLETLMSASKNWSNYRESIRILNPPCVPFLGRYLGDLTFIEDGNRDRLKENDQLINFGKRQKTAEVIREITIHQSTPYNLVAVPALEAFIEKNLVDARSADELYEQSLLLEPREREDEKIARLLQESGFL